MVAAAPDADTTEDEGPRLPVEVRQHLGLLLARSYEQTGPGSDATERFADLLGRLVATLDEVQRRDTAEFQDRLLAITPALRRFAISLTHDGTAADDLVQDTLLKAWRNRAGFAMGTNFDAWTFTILRNQFYTNHRKRRELPDEDGAQASRVAALPEQEGRLDVADMQAAVAQLTPAMREALMLVTVEDLTYEEAAAVMGCEVGTVKSRVWRARQQLVRLLGYDGDAVGQDPLILSAMGGGA
ncbi:sigma-70 family RNA polymerase sigma factor [Methylobacterium amylolyticum]|uniref:sigma-70 family RNA polymerase sigma factor n=1 Tax=Methylobacterium sp. NEAU 140 TaxID=3064945 RepID=UPI0035223E51